MFWPMHRSSPISVIKDGKARFWTNVELAVVNLSGFDDQGIERFNLRVNIPCEIVKLSQDGTVSKIGALHPVGPHWIGKIFPIVLELLQDLRTFGRNEARIADRFCLP